MVTITGLQHCLAMSLTNLQQEMLYSISISEHCMLAAPHQTKRSCLSVPAEQAAQECGPEDLVATEEMLERITAPGADYSGDFVEQFRLFTAELRDFFNAGSLADLLNALRPSLDDSGIQASLPLDLLSSSGT